MKTLPLIAIAASLIISASAFADDKSGAKAEGAKKMFELPAVPAEAPLEYLHVAFPEVTFARATDEAIGLTVEFPEPVISAEDEPLAQQPVAYPAVDMIDPEAPVID